jgi:hypothetical protein
MAAINIAQETHMTYLITLGILFRMRFTIKVRRARVELDLTFRRRKR